MAKKMQASWRKMLLILSAAIGLYFFLLYPGMQDFRDTLAFDILFRLVSSGAVMYFAWVWKKKPSPLAKWTLTAIACIVWFPLLIPSYRIFLFSVMMLEFVSVAVLLWEQINLQKHTEVLLFVTAVLLLIASGNASSYTFVENPNGMHFGLPTVLFTLLAGAFSGYLIFFGRLKLKDDRKSERITFVFAGFLVGFFLTWPTILNLNYLLDNQISQVYEMPVEEKDINTSGKNTSYHLYVSFQGGQLKLDVSQSQYYAYEPGDIVPVTLYEGAFHDPFYIVE